MIGSLESKLDHPEDYDFWFPLYLRHESVKIAMDVISAIILGLSTLFFVLWIIYKYPSAVYGARVQYQIKRIKYNETSIFDRLYLYVVDGFLKEKLVIISLMNITFSLVQLITHCYWINAWH
jgi:hypothetical protein